MKTWPVPGQHDPTPGDREHLAFLAHWLTYVVRGHFYRTAGPGHAVYYCNGMTAAFPVPHAHQDVLWEFITNGYVTDGGTTTLRLNGSDQDIARVVQLQLTCCGRQLWTASSTLKGS